MEFLFTLLFQLQLCLPAPTNTVSSPVAINKLSTPEFLVGKHNYYTDTNFVEIPAHMAYRTEMFLLDEVYAAYFEMYQAAKKEGVNLKIISASRTFEEQKWIWEDKWKKNKATYPADTSLAKFIMQYSAMPGTSRHHWGTEVDLNSTSDSYFATAAGAKVYKWLTDHASEYGFCQTYDSKGISRHEGYNEEKWHWSYFPIADPLLKKYEELVEYSHIQGFSGDNAAPKLDVINNYVLSISHECEK